MHHSQLIILSYHRFVEEESDYRFSRTYHQFSHDIRKKVYDWITIDDGMICQLRACEMLRVHNVRAKLFICTSLVGTKGYCSWDELRALSEYHDIENHSFSHRRHDLLLDQTVYTFINAAQIQIQQEIGKASRYFVAPYNTYNPRVEKIAEDLGLIILKDRVNILNISK
ncbi:MAG TPA: polysaccharide deacetylase family protein [Chitinophagaceae bacterium]|nr:polysaccharide deacetylase family protein [Chitinophagaceae bacterium]